MNDWTVRWVGDFGTITATAEDVETEEEAVEAARQQLLDWHGIDPVKAGFTLDEVQLTAVSGKPSRCEDFPCCGHEAGDCNGGLYGSDESIKNRIYAMSAEQFDAYLERPDNY